MEKIFKQIYCYLILFGSLLQSPLLLVCRLYWGWLFMQAGLEKLKDIGQFAELLQGFNFYVPYFQAYLAAFIEFLGGFLLLIGLASRLAALFLTIVMGVAYATVHIEAVSAFFSDPSQFVAESPFNFLLTSLIVLAFGPGKFSIDYVIERYKNRH